MRRKKLQGARPGGRIRFRSVAVPAAAIKTMRRIFVEEKLMGFAEPRQLGVELAHFIGWRVFIELTEMALDRARHIGRKCRRSRTITPILVGSAAIEIDGGLERFCCCGGEKRDAPAHAKPDDAEP